MLCGVSVTFSTDAGTPGGRQARVPLSHTWCRKPAPIPGTGRGVPLCTHTQAVTARFARPCHLPPRDIPGLIHSVTSLVNQRHTDILARCCCRRRTARNMEESALGDENHANGRQKTERNFSYADLQFKDWPVPLSRMSRPEPYSSALSAEEPHLGTGDKCRPAGPTLPGDVQPGRGVGSKLGASISRAPFPRPRGHSMSRDLLPEADQPGLSQALPELPSLLDHPHRLSLSRPSPSREVREGSSFRTCSGPSRQRGAPREYP